MPVGKRSLKEYKDMAMHHMVGAHCFALAVAMIYISGEILHYRGEFESGLVFGSRSADR